MTYYYTGPPNWFFSMFAFIAFLCSTIPLPWHLEAWNTGTCLYMIWTALANLILFINSIIWNGNVLDSAPVWCDISTHFQAGFNLAIPACSLCINRRLYHISSVRTVTKTRAEKRRAIWEDLAIGLGLPLLQIPLQYIVQGHRYNIFEDIGCLGETYETPVAIVLYHLPPILVGCVSAVYCTLSIRAFYTQRASFKALLSSSHNANLSLNRYLRLMLLAGTDLILTIPLGAFVLYVAAVVNGISPWISWDNTHSNFSRVVQVPGVFWRANVWDVASVEGLRWMTVGAGLLFFAYFGFADEAVKNYRGAWYNVARRVGLSVASTAGTGTLSSSGPQMSSGRPVFIRKQSTLKRDSLFDSEGSFSDGLTSAGLDSLSYMEKEEKGELSFGALDSASSSGSSVKDVEEGEIDLEEIAVPSLHRDSIAPPAAAHTRNSVFLALPTHVVDAADIV
ncbi:pheromone A receptor-domain-containing protein [Mycena galopus ATCC 62051]|nr:pheromone A receptor-domain-containing protein [Mycena galopus ATCC 62051]